MVEAMVVGLRLILAVEFAVEVPFADVTGCVALLLEQLGQGDLGFPQVDPVPAGNPSPDPVSIRGAPGQDGGAGRGTYGAGRVALSKLGPLFGEAVEVGGLDDGVPVAGEVTPAQVVGQEDDEVRLGFLLCGKEGERGKQ